MQANIFHAPVRCPYRLARCALLLLAPIGWAGRIGWNQFTAKETRQEIRHARSKVPRRRRRRRNPCSAVAWQLLDELLQEAAGFPARPFDIPGGDGLDESVVWDPL